VARKSFLFTSESVSEGHPDKVCDRISDEVVDAFYRESLAAKLDPWAIRAACETMATTQRVIIAGEYSNTPKSVTVEMLQHVTRKAIKDIGYEQDGFHWANTNIEVLLHGQSADIAAGVDAKQPTNAEEGAGDQGIMFGYACNDTPELMPAPIYYAHKILEDLARDRKAKKGDAAKLGPDSKSQVTVRYEDGKPVGVTAIVVEGHDLAHQPDRQVLHWRSRWRLRSDGPQNHRRYLRRRGASRRRRVLGQGPDQG
jgi:S-adenosylmethionine synthetase